MAEKKIMNGFRIECEQFFFSTIDYYESFRFSFHLHITFWSTEDHISNEKFQSVIHSK